MFYVMLARVSVKSLFDGILAVFFPFLYVVRVFDMYLPRE